jgi:hypothetical protein
MRIRTRSHKMNPRSWTIRILLMLLALLSHDALMAANVHAAAQAVAHPTAHHHSTFQAPAETARPTKAGVSRAPSERADHGARASGALDFSFGVVNRVGQPPDPPLPAPGSGCATIRLAAPPATASTGFAPDAMAGSCPIALPPTIAPHGGTTPPPITLPAATRRALLQVYRI